MMTVITYINTKTKIPNWVDNIHERNPRGYAYETGTHFVHFYGRNDNLYTISTGLTTIQAKKGTLIEWVKETFGAKEIEYMKLDSGQSIEGIWRPGLYFQNDILQALNIQKNEIRLAEQALRLLINKLDDILLYIEPDLNSLNTYSHKTRELFILACTEVENFWKYYITKSSSKPKNRKSYTTNDYVLLVDKLHLKEYQFSLKAYSKISSIIAFENWDSSNPTSSLSWYNSYNKTKHDRDSHFSEASLLNCIKAVFACLVMYCVRFSPYRLFDQSNSFSSLMNQHFDVKLVNADNRTFYIPKIELPVDTTNELICYDSIRAGHVKPFLFTPLNL